MGDRSTYIYVVQRHIAPTTTSVGLAHAHPITVSAMRGGMMRCTSSERKRLRSTSCQSSLLIQYHSISNSKTGIS